MTLKNYNLIDVGILKVQNNNYSSYDINLAHFDRKRKRDTKTNKREGKMLYFPFFGYSVHRKSIRPRETNILLSSRHNIL